MELAPGELGADGPYLVACGQYRHAGPAPDEHLAHAGGCTRGDVGGAQTVALAEEELMGDDVLSDRAHVLAGSQLREDLGFAVHDLHVLAHDDRVEGLGQRSPASTT